MKTPNQRRNPRVTMHRSFPVNDEYEKTERKSRPIWKIVLIYIAAAVVLLFMVAFLWSMSGPMAAVYIGIFGVMVFLPQVIRRSTKILYIIRRNVITAIRADEEPDFSRSQVIENYLVIFIPSWVMAIAAFALPWGSARGIFLVPSAVMLIIFGIWHGSIWTDIGWRRRTFVGFLTLCFLSSCGIGIGINALYYHL